MQSRTNNARYHLNQSLLNPLSLVVIHMWSNSVCVAVNVKYVCIYGGCDEIHIWTSNYIRTDAIWSLFPLSTFAMFAIKWMFRTNAAISMAFECLNSILSFSLSLSMFAIDHHHATHSIQQSVFYSHDNESHQSRLNIFFIHQLIASTAQTKNR